MAVSETSLMAYDMILEDLGNRQAQFWKLKLNLQEVK